MGVGRLAVLATVLVVACRLLLPRSSSAPPAAPPLPLEIDGRLVFGVRRRRRRRREQEGSSALSSPPPLGDELPLPSPPPPPAAEIAHVEATASGRAASSMCSINGAERGGGCHGYACLLAQCFCGDGRGGEFCEVVPKPLRLSRSATCAAEAAEAHEADGVHRSARHDVCAFYEPAYGIMAVDDGRWRAAQSLEAELWAKAPSEQVRAPRARASCEHGWARDVLM